MTEDSLVKEVEWGVAPESRIRRKGTTSEANEGAPHARILEWL
jgi:hypothetical protein